MINVIDTLGGEGQGDSEIQFYEFVLMLKIMLSKEDTVETIIDAFNFFDKDNSGYIDYYEFHQVIDSLDEDQEYSLEEIKDDLSQTIADPKRISFSDFIQILANSKLT